jgi:rare lipoprotein A
VLAVLSVAAWAMPVLATQTVTTRHSAVKQPAVKRAEPKASVRSSTGTTSSQRSSVARKAATAERKHYANGAACELTSPRRPSATHGKSASAGKPSRKRHDTGFASFYGLECANRPTANGERFDPGAMTAAHRTLPFGTRVRVTNLENGRQVVVRINDRGPYRKGRVLDLSRAAARKLGFVDDGVAHVRIEVLKERKSHHREWRPGELAVSAEPATPSGS